MIGFTRRQARSLVAIGLAISVFAACSSSSGSPAPSAAGSPQSSTGASAAPSSDALESDLVFSTRGGFVEAMFVDKIIPLFEEKYGVNVSLVIDSSGPGYAKLKAQQNNPQVDVFWSLVRTQVLGKIDGMWAENSPEVTESVKGVDEKWHDADNMGVPVNTAGDILVYNTAKYAENGITPPTSWGDVLDPKVAGTGHFAMGAMDASDGQNMLVAIARANGGDERNIDVAFEKLSALGDKLIIYKSPDQFEDLFKQEAAWVGVMNLSRAQALQESGFPIGLVYPEEGALSSGGVYMTAVANSPHPKAAQAFIDFGLTPEVQQIMAESGTIPLLKDLTVPPEVAAKLPTDEQKANFMLIDSPYIATVLDEWINRANSELGQ